MSEPVKKAEIPASRLGEVEQLRSELSQVLLGKESLTEAILSAIFSQGHILVEDVPGVGKTTVIKALAHMLGLEMTRIQCTSDLLPSDILGVEVYNANTGKFEFHRGPIFSNIVVADELNRTSPRTQSALLEAMGEGMVTVDRKTYPLPEPFVVFATQNPNDHIGTYPLPESQLDRFSVRVELSYPVESKELDIFRQSTLNPLAGVKKNILTGGALLELQKQTERVHLSETVVQYVRHFVDATRTHESLRRGVSTRGGVQWLRVARGRAVLFGRDYVIPDDLLAVANYCLAHRVLAKSGNDPVQVLDSLINKLEVE